MGYDLNFWKYKKGIYLDNQEVYEKGKNLTASYMIHRPGTTSVN